jgi:hypothetical protein
MTTLETRCICHSHANRSVIFCAELIERMSKFTRNFVRCAESFLRPYSRYFADKVEPFVFFLLQRFCTIAMIAFCVFFLSLESVYVPRAYPEVEV